jgi:hypothetical protein
VNIIGRRATSTEDFVDNGRSAREGRRYAGSKRFEWPGGTLSCSKEDVGVQGSVDVYRPTDVTLPYGTNEQLILLLFAPSSENGYRLRIDERNKICFSGRSVKTLAKRLLVKRRAQDSRSYSCAR